MDTLCCVHNADIPAFQSAAAPASVAHPVFTLRRDTNSPSISVHFLLFAPVTSRCSLLSLSFLTVLTLPTVSISYDLDSAVSCRSVKNDNILTQFDVKTRRPATTTFTTVNYENCCLLHLFTDDRIMLPTSCKTNQNVGLCPKGSCQLAPLPVLWVSL